MPRNQVVFCFFILAVLAFLIWYSSYQRQKIYDTSLLRHCIILNYLSSVKGGGGSFKCQIIDSNENLIVISFTTVQKGMQKLKGRFFPILYSKSYDDGIVLITPEDFTNANLVFPDSLKWVVEKGYYER